MAEINVGCLRYCIEIPLFLLFFHFMLSVPVNTNFVIYRTCYVSLGYNRSACEKLGASNMDNATRHLEKLVQPYANIIMMTQSLLTQIIPAFLCLFIGPWSDKHGRKPVLISTLTGFILGGLVTLTVVLIPTLSPWYMLVGCAPMVLFGGISPLFMAALCYVTDVTTEANRGMSFVVSKLEYASQVWSPQYIYLQLAIERVQRRFLKYLSFKDMGIYPERGSDYNLLLQAHDLQSLRGRRELHGARFIWKLCNGTIDCPHLLSYLNFYTPRIASRSSSTFWLPFSRTNLLRGSPLVTMCRAANLHYDDIFSVSNSTSNT